jgi:hypothetical protein
MKSLGASLGTERELDGKPQTIVIAATPTNNREVVSAKSVMPQEFGFLPGKGQQRFALGRGEQLAARHVPSLENLPLREPDPTSVRPFKKVAFTFSKTILDSLFSFLHL